MPTVIDPRAIPHPRRDAARYRREAARLAAAGRLSEADAYTACADRLDDVVRQREAAIRDRLATKAGAA